jgi:hypothetical protein
VAHGLDMWADAWTPGHLDTCPIITVQHQNWLKGRTYANSGNIMDQIKTFKT